MAANSKIEWTDATWNPVTGCTPVSPGCLNCYAARDARRLAGNPNPKVSGPYRGLAVVRDGRPVFNGTIRLHEDRLLDPLGWRNPRGVFVNSQSDLFHEDVVNEFIDRVFAVMTLCSRHTFQILTKRAARMLRYMEGRDRNGFNVQDRVSSLPGRMILERENRCFMSLAEWEQRGWPAPPAVLWPLPNVLLGFSAESQECFDERWGHFRAVAKMGWRTMVSCEPLLGPIVLPADFVALRPWVIVGGESGPKARPMHPDWARSIRDQCVAAGVPFLFKQWGEHAPADQAARFEHHGQGIQPFGDHQEVCRIGKKAAGRLLDGRTWDEFPEHFATARKMVNG